MSAWPECPTLRVRIAPRTSAGSVAQAATIRCRPPGGELLETSAEPFAWRAVGEGRDRAHAAVQVWNLDVPLPRPQFGYHQAHASAETNGTGERAGSVETAREAALALVPRTLAEDRLPETGEGPRLDLEQA